MKKTLFVCLAAVGLATLGSGCIATVDGNTRAAVPFRKDRITSRYQIPAEDIFNAAKEVLGGRNGGLGVLQSENRINNSLVAKVDTRTVYLRVTEVEPNIAELVVQVRTSGGGVDIDLAAEVDKQVALRLRP